MLFFLLWLSRELTAVSLSQVSPSLLFYFLSPPSSDTERTDCSLSETALQSKAPQFGPRSPSLCLCLRSSTPQLQ